MKITKLKFIINSGEETTLNSLEVQEFFKIINCGSILTSIKNLPKRLNKIIKYKFLLTACFRKLFRMKPSVPKNMRVSLLNKFFPNLNYEKIIKIEVNIKDKTIYFKVNKVTLRVTITVIKQVIKNNQYNVNKKNVNNKIIIDAGANMGGFSILTAFMGAKKVYAFEPVPSTANSLSENVKLNKMQDKIIVVNKALGDKNYFSKICFRFCGDGDAKLIDSKTASLVKLTKCEKVEIIKLDDFVSDNKIKKIDFIKMDVEGFEKNVIIGAKKTILKFKPVLSLSAYHKLTDKEILPKVIKSIRKDYKIILNNFDEEDFYCC